MTLQNRVNPFGEISAEPWRGALMGNRGCLHNGAGQLGVRRWRHPHWVCCLTAFKGRERAPMPPGRWTALFFWDEAAALSAGHRPCGQCRRADYRRFMAAWGEAGLPGTGPRDVDRHLHRHRVTRQREKVTFEAPAVDLPDGTFVIGPGLHRLPMLIWEGGLWHLSPGDGGYLAAGLVPEGPVTVLTPQPMVAILRAGYTLAPRFEAE